MSEPESMTCRPIPNRTESEVLERFLNRKGYQTVWNYSVRTRENNALVGKVAYFNLNKQNRSAEIGYLANPDFRRRGYIYEAISVLLKYLFNDLDLNKVMAQTGEFNEASIKLLEKLGFKQDGRLRQHHSYRGKLHDDLLFSILASEFNAK